MEEELVTAVMHKIIEEKIENILLRAKIVKQGLAKGYFEMTVVGIDEYFASTYEDEQDISSITHRK